MPSFTTLLEQSLTPSLPTILLAIVIILGAPLILHILLSRSSTYTTPPQILLIGPPSAGKTALLTLLERASLTTASVEEDGSGGGANAAAADIPSTHTSQTAQSVELNASTDSTNKHSYRNHDDTSGTYTKFLLVDTPGHGKLRNVAFGRLERSEKVRGVVFMVDASTLSEHDILASTASYLYDILLHLQQKYKPDKPNIPLLVAANKMDLFTALPVAMVQSHLEAEITRIRASRSKGLLDSGEKEEEEVHDGWLGEYGSARFNFGQMGEFGVDVEVLGGSVVGEVGVGKWRWSLE